MPTLSYPGSPSKPPKSSAEQTCQWEKDFRDVQAVAKHCGIPDDKVQLVDLSKEYWNRVFEPSVRIWEEGGTPNPDVMCNR